MTKPPTRTNTRHNKHTSLQGMAQPPRLRPALRNALNEIALKGRTQRDAAKIAGMNETALGRALRKPAVAAHLENLKAQAIIDATEMRGLAKAMAIQTGIQLMRESTSDAIKARMVEFFAGEGKTGALVNVNLSVNQGGYEFVKPGQQVVEIVPSQDSASSDQSAQTIEDAEILPDVGE